MQFEIAQAPDGSSMSLDVILLYHLARVTVGRLGAGQGYCDTEVLEMATEQTTHWQHQEFSRSEELQAALKDFFQRLHELSPARETPRETHQFELPLMDQSITLNALLEPLLAAASR